MRILASLGFAALGVWLFALIVQGSDRPYPTPQPVASADCAWHDANGHDTTPNYDVASVRVGGTADSPVMEQFVCLNGSLIGTTSPDASWPSTAVNGG